MPATAVGNANGKSTKASTSRRPANSYRTSTHATMKPKMPFTHAATNDAVSVSRYDATTRGSDTVAQNASQPIDAVRTGSVLNGMSTMIDRYSNVNPNVTRKPGNT